MKNPLNKRLLRELKADPGKYIVIFILMILTIGLCSGYKIAANSMMVAYNEGYAKYNIEDGNFTSSVKLNNSQKADVEDLGVTLTDQFYAKEELTNGTHIRIYKERDSVNTACLMEGRLPQALNEIVIDRMYADNNEIRVGDILTTDKGREYTVTGFIALPDYSCLFENANDTMFDAVNFGVAMVSADTFATYEDALLTYNYAWQYEADYDGDLEEKALSDDFKDSLKELISLKTYQPKYSNQAIIFTRDDIGSDSLMMEVLAYMLIALIAFVFAVTSKNTINKEANVIGTLRASGYTIGELVRHYLAMPVFVTLFSAVVGNILGYTEFKILCADMYYGSYSLPTYVTIWNADALVSTTLIPLALMVGINLIILIHNMRKPIQKFLRNDLSSRRRKKVLALSPKTSIFQRFKTRVILQNIPSIIIIFVGALFANIILFFCLAMPNVLDKFSASLGDNMFANYQYMLNMPVDEAYDNKLTETVGMLEFLEEISTDNEDAEKFTAYSLKTMEETAPIVEDVTIYGVEKGSRYIDISHNVDGVYISKAFADKYGLEVGDSYTLKEAYEDTTYTFRIAGIYDYWGSISIFMDMDDCNEMFDLGDGTFVGYFSDTEITDIDEEYIATVIDYESLTKVSRQLDRSMGSLMDIMSYVAVAIFMVIVYLLTKVVIEKNAHSVSVTKILGYSKGEIGNLYILSISIAVILCFILTIPLVYFSVYYIYRIMMAEMISGWLPFEFDWILFPKMIAMGVGTYAIVALLEYIKISRIRMDIALKVVE